MFKDSITKLPDPGAEVPQNIANPRRGTFICPDGLAYLPYQEEAIVYAGRRRATLLGDEMGLGKTIQAIGIINQDEDVRRILVVCPASLRINWLRELRKWLVQWLPIRIIVGRAPGQFGDLKGVTIINYDVLANHGQALRSVTWDYIVADEAHYLKNRKAKRTQALLGARGIHSLSARKWLLLSGTPMPNRPSELWSLLKVLDPRGLGSNWLYYHRRYCDANKTKWGWDVSGASHLQELQDTLRRKCMIRRMKRDVLKDLPPKVRQVIELPMEGAGELAQRELDAWNTHELALRSLREARDRARDAGDEAAYKDAVAALKKGVMAAFADISVLRHAVANAKVSQVVAHLKDAIEEAPVVCFAHHKDVIARIAACFKNNRVITGETAMSDRQAAVDDFQGGRADILIGNIHAAGVGLTLTRSKHVVFAEIDWVPSTMSQAEDRCHRIGQTDCVLIQHLVLEGSLDAVMAQRLIEKQEVISAALDDDCII